MVQDINEKYQTKIYRPLQHWDISVTSNVCDKLFYTQLVVAKLHSPARRITTPSWPHFLNTFQVCVGNVMAHAQKPDFVFRRNGRVHLNQRGSQFSRLLAAEVCASAVVMLDTPCSGVVWRVLATHSILQFPLHFLSLRHIVPSHFNWSLPDLDYKTVSVHAMKVYRRIRGIAPLDLNSTLDGSVLT